MTTDTEEQSALQYWRELGPKQNGTRRNPFMTQEDLAGLIGVKRPTVSLWENGHSQPTPAQMAKISEVLEIPITMLFKLG